MVVRVITHGNSSVSVYQLEGTTTALTSITGYSFPTGTSPVSIRFLPQMNHKIFAIVANNGTIQVSA